MRGETNFTLSGGGHVSLGEMEWMGTNEKRDNVIVNLAARESLGVYTDSSPDPFSSLML